MALLELDTEIKKELRDLETWTWQAGNILYVLFWALGTWLLVGTVMVGLSLIALIIFNELDAFTSGEELITIVKGIVYVNFFLSALVVIVTGIPKRLRNVFRNAATYRIKRQKAIFDQADLVENVLIRHGLITEDDASKAKSCRETL